MSISNTLDIGTYYGIVEEEMAFLNSKDLLFSITKKTSKYELQFLLDELEKKGNSQFWLVVLKQIIKVYSLNSLKTYLSIGNSIDDFSSEIKKLLLFIKTKLVLKFEYDKIPLTISRVELKKLLIEMNASKLLRIAIRDIDNESLSIFLNVLVRESQSDYTSD